MNSPEIISIKQVGGITRINSGSFEIKTVFNGKEVVWYYTPEFGGHPESLDADCDMFNPTGHLLLCLLREFLTRENPITSKMMKEAEQACNEMEQLL